ncbi:hypothetical protein [Flavobacterium chilense]|uniref:Uncharacterized protein n=1 Tax=Flavobacterium chilense TaxID=946677 RepID=A0A1M7F9P1_9FLAO|nr:hypothetical protein [Flavobacterium chilense]SHM00771.1 hypothetical protein SAMN05444484_103287 [Flavobacterium chilense]
MEMTYSSTTIKSLIKLGAKLIISEKYSSTNLKEFVSLAKLHNVPITLKINGSNTTTIKDLIKIGHPGLTLDL